MISQPGKRDFQIIDIKVMVWNFNFKSLVHHRMIKNFSSTQSSPRILSYTRQHFSQINNKYCLNVRQLKKNDELL